MSFFSNNPFVKIFGFWLIGLLSAKYCFQLLLPLALGFPIALVWYLRLNRQKRYPFDLVASALIAILLILLSAGNYRLFHPSIPAESVSETGFLAVLTERPTEKANSYQGSLKILQIENDSLAGYKLAAVFEKSEHTEELQAGQIIICNCPIRRIENSGNPYEFDYKSYMAQNGIYFRCYLSSGNYQLTQYSKTGLAITAEQIRETLLDILRQSLKKTESLEVIPALTLGYRKDLQAETRNWFVKTGAMHVLAVSGLHVGLIFLILSKLFFFLDLYNWGKWVKIVLIAALLWAYALITGFSPSVQRASLMFSFVLAAQSLKRAASIYNSIFASAFFLLLFNPDVFFAVGFQLSYAAVLSIVYFYPKIEQWWPVKNRILRWGWQLFCVSLAAQIGTIPLTLFYFNQFPSYFWLSNFVVIPAAFILLTGTMALLAFHSVPVIDDWLARILDTTTSIMLQLLENISNLPGSILKNTPVSIVGLFVLIGLILLLVLFIEYRKKSYLFGFLGLLGFFFSLNLLTKIGSLNQQLLLEYKGKSTCYHFISRRENILLCPDSSTLIPSVYRNSIIQLQLDEPVIVEWNKSMKFRTDFILIEKQLIQFGPNTYSVKSWRKQKFVVEKFNGIDSEIAASNPTN